MSGVRAAEAPALEQEPVPSANPLLDLLGDGSAAELIIEALQRLSCDGQSARWIDELLEDPRLGLLTGVREEAVRVLLAFGHPYALHITPEDLLRFRRLPPRNVSRGKIALGAGVGLAASVTADRLLGPLLDWSSSGYGLAALTLPLLWAGLVGLQALVSSAVNRRGLIAEVFLGLAVAVGLGEASAPLAAAPLLAAVVPVALAGLAGGWLED